MSQKRSPDDIIKFISSKNTWAAKLKRNAAAVIFSIDTAREGKCLNCGECCRLPIKCPFLSYSEGESRCKIYKLRPPSCRKYPRAEKEHITQSTCGYHFNR